MNKSRSRISPGPIVGISTNVAAPAGACGPGSLYEIQSTKLDLVLCDPLDRTLCLGRPWVYLAVDAFSRMITGVHVSIDAPTYATGLQVLWNACGEKVEFCHARNLQITPEDWPASGLPDAVVCDRGQLLCSDSDAIVTRLGITVQNTTARLVQADEVVRQLNELVLDRMGLPTTCDVLRSRSSAGIIPLIDFERTLLVAVLDHNHSCRPGLQLTSEMIQVGLEPRPLHIWKWGLATQRGMLRKLNSDWVFAATLPSGEAAITAQGIRFRDLVYKPGTKLMEGLLSSSRVSGSRQVTVHHDPNSVDRIWLLGSGNGVEVCTLIQQYDSVRGLNWRDYERHRKGHRHNSISL